MQPLHHSDLTTGAINGHLKRIAIPASVGFLFNTLFNVVDTFYAGRLSTEALAGLTISFPVFFIIIALSAGLGNAVSALSSIELGKKDSKSFHQLNFNAIIFGTGIGLLISIFAPLATKPLFQLLGAQGNALVLGVQYTNTIFFGATFFVLNAILNGMLSAQGNTKAYRNFLIIGFFLNLVLDPLFIFGWFGLPKFGVIGIAFATIVVQMIGTIYLFTRLSGSPWFKWLDFFKSRLSVKSIIELLKQAIPASLNMLTIAIGIFIINYFVIFYGGTRAIAGYGVAVRIEQIALLPALGLNVAALTIAGQNYGAHHHERIKEVMKKAIFYGVLIMIVGGIIIFPLAPYLISIFNQDQEVIRIGTRYLRIEIIAFATYVLLNVCVSILQAIKKPNFAVYIGTYRQVLPFLLFYFLGTTLNMGLDGVWVGIIIINWSAVFITLIYTHRQLKKLKHT